MTSETSRIADQLRRSYHGEAWHGPSLAELLSGVTEIQAGRRPVASAHSIWEIVLHIAWWERATLEALRGVAIPQDEQDWPERVELFASAAANLRSVTDELAAAIEQFPLARLEEIAPGRQYSFAFLMHGVVQHNLYHAGQIAILKKP